MSAKQKKVPKEFIGAAKFRIEKMERIPECTELRKGCGRHRFLFAYYNQCILIKSDREARRMTFELNERFTEPLSKCEINQMISRVHQHREEPGLDIHGDGVYIFSTEKLVEFLPISYEKAREMGFLKYIEKMETCKEHQKEAAERDWEIAKLWLAGLSARKISKELEGKFDSVGVTERTVRNVVKRLGIKENRNIRIEDIDFTMCARYSRRKKSDSNINSENIPLNVEKGNSIDVDDTEVRERLLCDLTLRKDCNILGAPGTGKSTLIKKLRHESNLNIKMTAYTGVAAERISGETIHSCLGIPVLENYGMVSPDTCSKISEMESWDVLVIDEIGMVSKDLLEFIRAILVQVEETYAHHIQLVTLGDFNQLAPINGEYAFRSSDIHWDTAYVLTKIYRQSGDLAFAEALHQISVGDVKGMEYINTHAKCGIGYVEMIEALEEGAIYLGSYREDVSRINRIMTVRHRSDHSYKEFQAIWEKVEVLPAYAGMPILITKKGGKLKKGTKGVITKVGTDYVVVKTNDNISHRLRRMELEDEEGVPYEQFPFKPCYAMTIHKSQGATIDEDVILNPTCFEGGQLYTALSRVHSLNQIRLTKPIEKKDMKVSKEVVEYMQTVS